MLRSLMIAAFFLGSASISAEELNALKPDQSSLPCQKSHKCKHPKRGPPGPQGAPGTSGIPGPTGPTGPEGPPSGDSIIPYATGDQILSIGGEAGSVYTLNYNETGTPFPPLQVVDGVLVQPDVDGVNDVSFNLPEDRVISALYASFTYAKDLFIPNPPGIEINMTAEVWVAPPENPTQFTYSGVGLTFPPFITPAIPPNVQFVSVGPSTFNVPVRAGSRIILLYTAVSSEPLPHRVLGTASAGIRL